MKITPPPYLFHYTTVETLAMILKERTIRFSPLTVLDDRQEEKVKDDQKYGKYVFVSAWTEEDRESIPMWNLHSNLSRGVRIKMRAYPFMEYPFTKEAVNAVLPNNTLDFVDFPQSIIVPVSELYRDDYVLHPRTKNRLLHKVFYTDDINKLEPQIAETTEEGIFYHLSRLGRTKNMHWSFQKEWRYILYFYINNLHQNGSDEGLPFDYYYLKMNDAAFCGMELTLSPKISDGNRVLVDLLRDAYNPGMEIRESALLNMLR